MNTAVGSMLIKEIAATVTVYGVTQKDLLGRFKI